MQGKTINLYLIDGEPTKRIKCTLQNWTGLVYKIPRTMLEDCKEGTTNIVKDMKKTGIYFLLGEDAESSEKIIYIGQAVVRKNGEGLLGRILEHKRNTKEKYWNDWNEVIVLTTQNNSFGPTEISYLENKFTALAMESKRYIVKNSNEPNQGNITEEKESELYEYIDYAKMIIGVLGHNAFEPIIKPLQRTQTLIEKNNIFKYKGKFDARGILTTEGFVILSGSEINPIIGQSKRTYIEQARENQANKINANNRTTEDILFSSPSAAACFIGGCSLSGNAMWITEDGKSPKDV